MKIIIYDSLKQYNPKLLINGEIIEIPETKDNQYFNVSGIGKPCINSNAFQIAVCDLLNSKYINVLTSSDINALHVITKKLNKKIIS